METQRPSSFRAETPAQRAAVTSPIRLEILGLFTGTGPLAISDMARLMGRPAGSLYHHVGVLEDAGILRRTGTRPKGKRYETLFEPCRQRVELKAGEGDAEADRQAVQALKSAFRMTLRDLEAALAGGAAVQEGPARNLFAGRIHLRAAPDLLARLNEHLDAIGKLLEDEAAHPPDPGPDDLHLSLTLALLPLRGRGPERTQDP